MGLEASCAHHFVVALVLGFAASATPASATPTADFTYKPLLPQLGEPVSLWAGGVQL